MIRPASKKNNSFPILGLLLFFGILYALVSLVNHYFFRTYALDLGFYSNALYDYRHLRWNYSPTIAEQPANMLGGHFEPILFLLAPFSFLFGSYTLLLIQILFLLWGGYTVYRYFKDAGKYLSWAAATFFLGYFSVFGALSFDFHTNVIAAAMAPALFLYVKKDRWAAFAGVFVAMLLCKENIAIWLFFIALGLAFEQRKNKPRRNRLLLFSALAAAYFGVVLFGIIPLFSPTGKYTGFLYSALGSSPSEAVRYMLTHPWGTVKLLFTNTASPGYDGYKQEFHAFIFLSGLPLLLFRPAYLWMLVPLYLQKMLHDQPSLWGVSGHYGVEFAPILAIGVFEAINGLRNQRTKTGLAIGMAVLSIALSIHSMDSTVTYIDKSRLSLFRKSHYTQTYEVSAVYQILRQIPPDAGVSAQSVFIPHLAFRDRIYQFPMVKDAEFIVYTLHEHGYPLSDEDFLATTTAYINRPDWEVWLSHEDFYVLKKRP